MKKLFFLLLLIPSLSWAKVVVLNCNCEKMDTKYQNSHAYSDLVGCFNNQAEKKQSINIKYLEDEPFELTFSLTSDYIYKDLKKVNDTEIKFGRISISDMLGTKIVVKESITINRDNLRAQYKWVQNQTLSEDEINNLIVDINDWDNIIFDENYRDFMMINYLSCEISNKKI